MSDSYDFETMLFGVFNLMHLNVRDHNNPCPGLHNIFMCYEIISRP